MSSLREASMGPNARRRASYASSRRAHFALRSRRVERAQQVHAVYSLPPLPPPCMFRFPELPFSSVEADGGLEQMAAYDRSFHPTQLFLKRITACVGWAVHGLVFEFVNNMRMGVILEGDSYTSTNNLSDEAISLRSGVGWTDIEYGDYIVGMHGDRLANPRFKWFCHTMTLEFASGKSIRYESNHEPWRGGPFSYVVPQPCLVYRITFKHGQAEDMQGLRTSVHLTIAQAMKTKLEYLPVNYLLALKEIQWIASRIDLNRSSSGRKPLGNDVWRAILGMILVWEVPVSPY